MKKVCEDCKWYYFWDSAYGKCKRFPPQEHLRWNWRGQKTSTTRYPFVSFGTNVCGEFKEV